MLGDDQLEDILLAGAVPDSNAPRLIWATVTSVTPTLKVRRSGESDTAAVNVKSSGVSLSLIRVGDYVQCIWQGAQLMLITCRAALERMRGQIPANADLNNYQEPGEFYSPSTADVQSMSHTPPSEVAGSLVVLESAGVVQRWSDYNDGRNSQEWRRRFYGGNWSEWVLDGLVVTPTGLSLINGWVSYSTGALGYGHPSFHVGADGRVHLSGLIKGGTVNSIVAQLPWWAQPERNLLFATVCNTGVDRLDVDHNGNITSNHGVNGFVSLNGASFLATGYSSSA